MFLLSENFLYLILFSCYLSLLLERVQRQVLVKGQFAIYNCDLRGMTFATRF